jgi:DNA-binding transcriptional regulator YdaS (Cro superfamily)
MEKGIKKAITYAGSQVNLAKKVNCTSYDVSKWLNGRQRIPAEKVLKICLAVDYAVMPYELRPDLYLEAWHYK